MKGCLSNVQTQHLDQVHKSKVSDSVVSSFLCFLTGVGMSSDLGVFHKLPVVTRQNPKSVALPPASKLLASFGWFLSLQGHVQFHSLRLYHQHRLLFLWRNCTSSERASVLLLWYARILSSADPYVRHMFVRRWSDHPSRWDKSSGDNLKKHLPSAEDVYVAGELVRPKGVEPKGSNSKCSPFLVAFFSLSLPGGISKWRFHQ